MGPVADLPIRCVTQTGKTRHSFTTTHLPSGSVNQIVDLAASIRYRSTPVNEGMAKRKSLRICRKVIADCSATSSLYFEGVGCQVPRFRKKLGD